MYEKFFGFSQKPFEIVPNPRFLFLTEKHQTALTYLEYGLREGNGFILLTGDIGSGKITLVRHLLGDLPRTMDVAVIFSTILTPGDLLEMIVNEFELTPVPGNKNANLDLLQHYLIDKYATGRKVLLIIDEAQNLSTEVLEEVRMLSNLQSDDRMLLQIMLVGQPELQDKLSRPNLAQLAQRIVVSYHLGPLTPAETVDYIRFRLGKVGGHPDLFAVDAMDRIFELTGGIPRAINIVCDTALVYAYADGADAVDLALVNQVAEDRGVVPFRGLSAQDGRGAGLESSHDGGRCHACERRLTTLEEAVVGLRESIAGITGELSVFKSGTHHDLVRSLTDLLMRERVTNQKLLVRYSQVSLELKSLKERVGGD